MTDEEFAEHLKEEESFLAEEESLRMIEKSSDFTIDFTADYKKTTISIPARELHRTAEVLYLFLREAGIDCRMETSLYSIHPDYDCPIDVEGTQPL